MITDEREAFRQIALKLLEKRDWNDYNAFIVDDWIKEWLKETAYFTSKMLAAEYDFIDPPKETDER